MNASPSRRRIWLALAFILVLATGLRFYRIGAPSLWSDEGNSAALATRSLTQIARDAANDIHPPLYYWLLSAWTRLVGSSEAGLRSLSALAGVALVALVYALGRLLAGRAAGLLAALLAAINPFQVYYSQEARMYMVLAALGALAFYAALMWAAALPGEGLHRWGLLYVLVVAAGLYTHYAFPLILVAVNLVVLLQLVGHARSTAEPWRAGWRRTWRWAALHVGALMFFAPWLPTAVRQLTQWPGVSEPLDLAAALLRVSSLQFMGWARTPPSPLLAGLALLALVAALLPWRRGTPVWPGVRLLPATVYLAPVAWFLLPPLLILGVGLYKEAYLKFLLVAAPALSLLLGRMAASVLPAWGEASPASSGAPGARGRGVQRTLHALAAFFILALSLGTSGVALARLYALHPDYARDDYRGIAATIEALGRPGDAILLNAPGQQEVFGYYYSGDLPLHPLPRQRPLDPAATQAELEALAQPGGRIFAVLWGTEESDPERLIERWLDAHAYQAFDVWYGNVRLALYAVPQRAAAAPDQVLDVTLRSPETGDEITLWGYSLLDDRVPAGDIAQLTFFWRAAEAPQARYKAFVHLLDAGNHIVGQRDSEPGGAQPTTGWTPGEVVAGNFGVLVHPATPPGEVRVEAGLYDAGTGQRLVTPEGAGQIWLPSVVVERPRVPAPVAALGMQHQAGADFGELVLLGYDAYKLGDAENAPLQPGDVLHVGLYWRAATEPHGLWRVALQVVDSRGHEWASMAGEPVGGYSTDLWQVGDVWRGQFNLFIPGDAPAGRYRVRIQPIPPAGSVPDPFLTGPLEIVP